MALKRGDKHPTENLIFFQYHKPFYKETNGEVWLSPEKYQENIIKHNISTKKNRLNNPLSFLTTNSLQRGKKYTDNDITVDFIKKLWEKQRGICYWYNVPMTLETNINRNPFKVTIDRLDNTKGYLKDNVVLACYAANCGRGNCSVENWKEFLKTLKNEFNNT